MAATTSISYYHRVGDIRSDRTIPFDIFLESIRDGKWQDMVLPIRAMATKEERDAAKKLVPSVTIAGKFKVREDAQLDEHSGYLAMDFDDLKDVNEFKSRICTDRYVVAAFTSISGRGLCVVFRVNPEKHKEAFQGLGAYLYEKYGEPCDPTSVNVSRCRFVSFDPDIYINSEKVERFTKYPKNKPPKKIDKVIYAPDDFKYVLDQVITNRINLCENYHEWIRICFGLSHQFGEAGRPYFHIISQYSSKYNPEDADKQYTVCLKHSSQNVATIAMFYYYCKQAGLDIYSERTKKIAYTAINGKKSGLSQDQVCVNLNKFEGISGAEDIVRQVMDNNITIDDDSTLVDQLDVYMRQTYEFRRNAVTRYIEKNGSQVKKQDLNTIFLHAKKVFENISFEMIDRYVESDFVKDYNPFFEFFDANNDTVSGGHIETLFKSIKTPYPEHALYFGRKWMVGAISAIHGIHSPLMLVLSGFKQNTGKTQFFRRMIPPELKIYYAESKLDAGTDDQILMCKKWVIMDDEMGGKSKKENKLLKDITSKDIFSLREPYGHGNVDLKRLAVLCGTTNDNEILNDPSGNRRILPIQVDGIDFSKYNSVDKTALWMEAYWLYKSGFAWELTQEDIEFLADGTASFEVTCMEAELIQRHYEIPVNASVCDKMTTTDIKVELDGITRQKLILDRIGKEMKRLGFEQRIIKVGSTTKRYWLVVKQQNNGLVPYGGDVPF